MMRNKIRIQARNEYDVTKYEVDWEEGYNRCFFDEPLPKKVKFCNPPFTRGIETLWRSAEEFLDGGDMMVLLPSKTVENFELWKDCFDKCVVKVEIPREQFLPFEGKLDWAISLLWFCQPETIE